MILLCTNLTTRNTNRGLHGGTSLFHKQLQVKSPLDFDLPYLEDLRCGNQSNIWPSNKKKLTVAAFGGSVTADGSYTRPLQKDMGVAFSTSVEFVNYAEPATGPEYASLCGSQALLIQSTRVDVVLVEYCQNDFDPGAADLIQLVESLMVTHFVFYYCHYSPRLITRINQGFQVPEKHWNEMINRGLAIYRTKHMMELMKPESVERFFRDAVHLTPLGGQTVAKQLSVAITHCLNRSPAVIDALRTSSTVDHHLPRCYSSLGPRKSRNIHRIIRKNSGWEFKEDNHPSAPNGKNGYEAKLPGKCISFEVPDMCERRVFLFYLQSNSNETGDLSITIKGCRREQLISTFAKKGYNHATRAQLEILAECCAENLTKEDVEEFNICSMQNPVTHGSRVRILSIATAV